MNETLTTDQPEVETSADEQFDALLAENAELKNTLRLRDARDTLTCALAKAGARSPELLFEAARSSLQFDDQGSLANAEAILGSLRLKFPEQFGERGRPANIGAGSGASASINYLTPEALAQMTPAEIARLDWEIVREVLASAGR